MTTVAAAVARDIGASLGRTTRSRTLARRVRPKTRPTIQARRITTAQYCFNSIRSDSDQKLELMPPPDR
jgi:hypothetical protein